MESGRDKQLGKPWARPDGGEVCAAGVTTVPRSGGARPGACYPARATQFGLAPRQRRQQRR